MLTLLSTLLGAGVNFIPAIIGYFQKKQDQAHELALTQLQYQAKKEGLVIEYNAALVKADTDEGKSVRSHDSDIDGGKFINGFRGAIRPTITLLFFLFFMAFKASIIYMLFTTTGLNVSETIQLAWDSDTSQIFASIMAFWFGNRMIASTKYKQLT